MADTMPPAPALAILDRHDDDVDCVPRARAGEFVYFRAGDFVRSGHVKIVTQYGRPQLGARYLLINVHGEGMQYRGEGGWQLINDSQLLLDLTEPATPEQLF